MGGLVIETIRPGVQFTPEGAAAFRRAEAQVRAEFGRDIDANSTYRSRFTQLGMYNAWVRYVNSGYNPLLYPGHSKALHPDDPLAFHTKGTALDSDDWVHARIVEILAENGFIRNRLYVPNERHHFEYIRDRDTNYGKPAGGNTTPAISLTILKELDMDKAVIIYFAAGGEKGWALIGATVPGGVRSSRSQATANRWARIYGKAVNCKSKAEFQATIDEAKALNDSWLEQQKQIHG
ncbi:hypothetical protein [Microbacterium sp. W4I20]|uniref:hypothetical protein n=1 Tax=Microbacterium sp. W4I20 TaxID=3042262 RepID=UPI002784EF05|nr:hypothetical protein [Microbacterium sp. W4I20]MDQ0726799.1 hypothetical protein [Microbacterium sp. W4I20]